MLKGVINHPLFKNFKVFMDSSSHPLSKRLTFESNIEEAISSTLSLQPKLLKIPYEFHCFISLLNTRPYLLIYARKSGQNTLDIFNYKTQEIVKSVETDIDAIQEGIKLVSSDDEILVLEHMNATHFYNIETLSRITTVKNTYSYCIEKRDGNILCIKRKEGEFVIDIFVRNLGDLNRLQWRFDVGNIDCISEHYIVSTESDSILRIFRYDDTIYEVSTLELNPIVSHLSKKENYLAIYTHTFHHQVILYDILSSFTSYIPLSSALKHLQFTNNDESVIILEESMILTYYYTNTHKRFSYQIHPSDRIHTFHITNPSFGIVGLYQDFTILSWNYANFNDVEHEDYNGVNVVSPDGLRFYIEKERVKIYSHFNTIGILNIYNISKVYFSKDCYLYSTREIYSLNLNTFEYACIFSIEAEELVDFSSTDADILEFYANENQDISYIICSSSVYIYDLSSRKTLHKLSLVNEKPLAFDLSSSILLTSESRFGKVIYHYDLSQPSNHYDESKNIYTNSEHEILRIYKDKYYLIATSLPEIEVRDAKTRVLKFRIDMSEKVSNMMIVEDYAVIQNVRGEVIWYDMIYKLEVIRIQMPKGIQSVYLSEDREEMYFNCICRSFKYKYPFRNKEFYIYGSEEQTVGIINSLYDIATKLKTKYNPDLKLSLISPGPLRLSDIYLYFNIPKALKASYESEIGSILSLGDYSALDWAIEKGGVALLGIIINATIAFIKKYPKYGLQLTRYLIPLNNTGHPLLYQLYEDLYILNKYPGIPKSCSPDVRLPISRYSSQVYISPTEFISKPDLDKKGQLIEFKSFIIPLNYSLGSKQSLEFLQNILRCKNQSVFATDFIQTYVNKMWEKGCWVLIIEAIIYIAYLITLSKIVLEDFVDLPELVAFTVLNSILLAIELVQIGGSGLAYFRDIWNLIDISRSIISFICIASINGDITLDSNYEIISVVVVLSSTRGVSYFRVNKKTRFFINLLFEVVKDMSAFIVILVYTVVSYCFVYLSLFGDAEGNISPFEDSLSSAISLMFGDISNEPQDEFAWIITIIFLIINPIIMLNLLITILGETYDRVKGNSIVADNIELVELVIEASQLLVWNRKREIKMYYQVCKPPASIFEIENPVEGKLNRILQEVGEISKKIDRRLNDFDGRLEEIYKIITNK
jgi:hypothetical protein